MLNFGKGKVANVLPQQLTTSIWCYWVIETEHTLLIRWEDRFFWQHSGLCQVKQSEIGFIRMASIYVRKSCVFLWHIETVRSDKVELLNIKIGTTWLESNSFYWQAPNLFEIWYLMFADIREMVIGNYHIIVHESSKYEVDS